MNDNAYSIEKINSHILSTYTDVVVKNAWGETSFFYNPDNRLPRGVYFATIKIKDGENDSSSELDRPNIFRLSIGVGNDYYELLFGSKPSRPAKGETVGMGIDFSEVDILMPHPVYAWMGWVSILSPLKDKSPALNEYIKAAYQSAVIKFNKRMK
tara:strand:+ start:141 stop:605 length:465 start_codon:yes stop_codon:yes gene_type:complete